MCGRRDMRRYLFVLMMCIGLLQTTGHTTYAQTQTETSADEPARNITASEWKELTNDKDFSYRDKVEHEEIKPIENSALTRFIRALASFLTSTGGRILMWSLLLLVVAYAVYKLVIGERGGIFGKRSQKGNEEETAVIEDINETNWEKLLDSAAKEGDLRMAVRYSYMLLLQVLEQSELIQYRNDKTNYQYASELADTPYKQPFRQLSRQYEYTWYGNFPISDSSYREYMDTLMTLKNKLGR